VSGKRQLFLDRKDADSLSLPGFNVPLAREDESCFGKIHLASDRLHLLISQTARIGKDGERIARKRRPRENIKLHEFVTVRHPWALLFETIS
jgi:hypothetical protein